MKKLLLILLFTSSFSMLSQTDFYTVLANNGDLSSIGRAPQGSRVASRSVWLITAAEMTASGFSAGSLVNSIGFNLSAAQNVATTGSFVVYLQNTTDATNTKSTTWTTAITGMTTVSNANATIPATVGTFDIPFTGGSAFTYTGESIYVAFDYQNLSGPLATTSNTVLCNTSLVGGLKGAVAAAGATTAPNTIAVSNFRPETRLGKSVTCARPINLNASSTLNSANLSWTSSANVELEWGPYNFTPGAGTTVTNIPSPYALSGLTPSTAYEYYVRTNCGAGSFSVWQGPYPFHTIFQSAFPTYNTGFEQEDLSFIGWATPNAVPVAGDWSIGYYGPGALVQNGNSSVASVTPAAAAADNWMFSRGINLTAGSSVTITYYISNYQNGTTATGNYQLTVGNNQSVASQSTILANETGVTSVPFVLKTYTFTPSTTGAYYFGFRNYTPMNAAGQHALIIDNFTVTQVLNTDEILAPKFSVYPNPVKDVISITNSENITINEIQLTDLNGRVVKQKTFNQVSDIQVNISDLASGIYMMNINSDQGSGTKKIIKN